MNEIAVISMARNDDFFIPKWVAYYGDQFGKANLYLILDGLDQIKPEDQEINCIRVPHKKLSRAKGDKNRVAIVSNLAKALFKRYKRVIACDIDEFLVLDPKNKNSLYNYLIQSHSGASISAQGIDVGQHIKLEKEISVEQPFLAQRNYGLVSSRYTKPVVALQPIQWGSGFHRVKGKNFHIDQNLFLFHFGMVDFQRSTGKTKDQSRIDQGWTNHLDRRFELFKIISEGVPAEGDEVFDKYRIIQNWKRPLYAWNKPGTLTKESLIKIPQRFHSIV
ncbi:glycosyltransferase family 2 protein [Flavobacteriaceae bacterium]|nr:glycosyltransferase family 2 protein [Flavobacteriaceae bacterium]